MNVFYLFYFRLIKSLCIGEQKSGQWKCVKTLSYSHTFMQGFGWHKSIIWRGTLQARPDRDYLFEFIASPARNSTTGSKALNRSIDTLGTFSALSILSANRFKFSGK